MYYRTPQTLGSFGSVSDVTFPESKFVHLLFFQSVFILRFTFSAFLSLKHSAIVFDHLDCLTCWLIVLNYTTI